MTPGAKQAVRARYFDSIRRRPPTRPSVPSGLTCAFSLASPPASSATVREGYLSLSPDRPGCRVSQSRTVPRSIGPRLRPGTSFGLSCMIRSGHHEATRRRRRCWTEWVAVLSTNPSLKRLQDKVVLHLRPSDWEVAIWTRRLVSTRGLQSRIRLSTSLGSATTDSQPRATALLVGTKHDSCACASNAA
jgi:hypothetical protein